MSQNKFLNPFRYVAGTKALLAGLIGIIAAALIAWKSNTHFDGVLDAHFGNPGPIHLFMLEGLIAWLCAVIVFYITALILAGTSIRLIDITGTMAFARLPMIIVALMGFFVTASPVQLDAIDPLLIILAIVTMVFAIWMIIWMYQAYITSTNLKGAKATISFIIALLIAEVISKLIFSLTYFNNLQNI